VGLDRGSVAERRHAVARTLHERVFAWMTLGDDRNVVETRVAGRVLHRRGLRRTVTPPRLALRGITKRYPAVVANDGIDLAVEPGEIHAVLGENGAGKSTLMKIVYGAVRPDAGTVHWNGQPVEVASPAAARALGISMVYQHFSLFDTLTAAENVWLGLDKALSLAEVTARLPRDLRHLRLAGRSAPAGAHPLRRRAAAGRDRARTARRAQAPHPRRADLGAHAAGGADALRDAAPAGVGGLLDPLHLAQARRDPRPLHGVHGAARRPGDGPGRSEDGEQRRPLAADDRRRAAGARPPGGGRRRRRARGARPLSAEGRSVRDGAGGDRLRGEGGRDRRHRRRLGQRPAGADARSLGRIGHGRLARTARHRGAVRTDIGRAGRARERARPAIRARGTLGRGAVPTLSLAANTLLTRTSSIGRRTGWIRTAQRARSPLADRALRVKAGGPARRRRASPAATCRSSWSARDRRRAEALVVSQPTWGVDVGAAAQIRGELLALRDRGCAVLVVSEELDELFEICDRLLVIAQGRVSPSVPTTEATVETIGQWMSGLWDRERVAVPA
jgi:simple sugar transport system ATP-binding protein